METNKELRKYSRRKNSNAASSSLPNSEAALDSSPSVTDMGLINVDPEFVDLIRRILEENNNFRIREYVAGIREKDVRMCFPFPYDENNVDIDMLKRLLPPTDLPEKIQFPFSADQPIGNDNQSPVTARSAADRTDNQMPQFTALHLVANVPEGATVSANEANILSNGEHHAVPDGQGENNSEVTDEAITEHQMMNLDAISGTDMIPQLSSACASPAVLISGVMIQENPENDCVPVHDEPPRRNPRRLARHKESSRFGGAAAAADSQQNTSGSVVRSVRKPTVVLALPAAENSNISSSSSSFRRRKPRKMRLMRDILADVRSLPRPDQLNRNLVTLHVSPGPQDTEDNQTNEERLMLPEEVDISSSAGRLSRNGLMNKSWSCSRPRLPRRRRLRTKGIFRSSLEPIPEDDRENEDFSDDATQVSLSDDLTVKSAPATCKTKEHHHIPLGDTSGESNEPERMGELSREMSNLEMPKMDDKHGYISQVDDDDGINISKQQEDQVTDKRSNQKLEDPVNVVDTGIIRLFGYQVSFKEMPKETNGVADKAKSADCLSPLGANHLHSNSAAQSLTRSAMAQVSMSKGKAPMDISSLEHGSSPTMQLVSEGYDIENSEASLIWKSQTPMDELMPEKVHEDSQPINVRGKNIVREVHLPDLNVPCLEAMALDSIMEESSLPWKKLEGSVNTYPNCTIPVSNLLTLTDSSELSSAMTPVGASNPLGTKLCHNGSDRNDLRNINISINSSKSQNKMKRSIGSAQEMATKSKGSPSKVGEFPQDSSMVPFQISGLQDFEALPETENTSGWPSIGENESCAKKQKVQSEEANATSFALADTPEPMNCVLNRNPADFSAPDPENPYMINGKYLKIGRARANQRASGSNWKAASKKGRGKK